MISDDERTLTEIENNDWGEPNYDSGLVIKCHQLRKKPLKEFSTEDLRLMIGQNNSLETLIPIALSQLHIDILAEGDFYPGDLLNNVLRANAAYWDNHESQRKEIIDLFKSKQHLLEDKSFRKIRTTFEEFADRWFKSENT